MPEGRTAGELLTLCQRLIGSYDLMDRQTAALRWAVERDDTEALAALIAEREAALDAAEQLIAAIGRDVARIPVPLRRRLGERLDAVRQQDDHLRALLSARTLEVPAQLAEVRHSRARLGRGYGPFTGAPGAPEMIDRRA